MRAARALVRLDKLMDGEVDSLIVTDLIELARNGAIGDAVLMSGDEDVRIGVQIAQSFGVRIHLLGIEPQRGSQSLQLLREADTTTEWNKALVDLFLSVEQPLPASTEQVASPVRDQDDQRLAAVVKQVSSELLPEQIAALVEGWKTSPTIPGDLDGRLLGKAGEAVDRLLTAPEKTSLRRLFREHVKEVDKITSAGQ